jgi:radical SAM-linked protein
MVFALPLSTGVESVCELLDIKLNSYMSNEEIMQRLNDNFPRDMRVLEVYTPEIKFKNIEYAEYTLDLYSPKIDGETASKIDKLFEGECLIDKKTKSGVKTVDIRDYIKEIATQGSENHIKISAIVYANNEKNLNPDLIVTAIKKHLDIMTTERTEEYYTIMRQRFLDSELHEFN